MKYDTFNVIFTTPSLCNNCSAEAVELLGRLKLSCNFTWKSLAGYAHSVSLGFCCQLINVCSGMTCPLQIGPVIMGVWLGSCRLNIVLSSCLHATFLP